MFRVAAHTLPEAKINRKLQRSRSDRQTKQVITSESPVGSSVMEKEKNVLAGERSELCESDTPDEPSHTRCHWKFNVLHSAAAPRDDKKKLHTSCVV